ncbi:MAG TPA: hypothetical protein VKJ65_13380 [Phycisphaerae bacterium]|nr:hypothetical protein [Phycisphaerae bacterium]
MAQRQRWLQSSGGKAVTLFLALAAVGLCIWAVKSTIGGSTPGDPNDQTYVDSATNKAFQHRNVPGESVPILAPSGSNTGYPAEPCYWTADGGTKTDPTWVILNQELGKPGPTFCPDCGRLVVGHNPTPGPGVKPPPTQQELLHSNAGYNSGR